MNPFHSPENKPAPPAGRERDYWDDVLEERVKANAIPIHVRALRKWAVSTAFIGVETLYSGIAAEIIAAAETAMPILLSMQDILADDGRCQSGSDALLCAYEQLVSIKRARLPDGLEAAPADRMRLVRQEVYTIANYIMYGAPASMAEGTDQNPSKGGATPSLALEDQPAIPLFPEESASEAPQSHSSQTPVVGLGTATVASPGAAASAAPGEGA